MKSLRLSERVANVVVGNMERKDKQLSSEQKENLKKLKYVVEMVNYPIAAVISPFVSMPSAIIVQSVRNIVG